MASGKGIGVKKDDRDGVMTGPAHFRFDRTVIDDNMYCSVQFF